MREDETGTLAQLKVLGTEVFDPCIVGHNRAEALTGLVILTRRSRNGVRHRAATVRPNRVPDTKDNTRHSGPSGIPESRHSIKSVTM